MAEHPRFEKREPWGTRRVEESWASVHKDGMQVKRTGEQQLEFRTPCRSGKGVRHADNFRGFLIEAGCEHPCVRIVPKCERSGNFSAGAVRAFALSRGDQSIANGSSSGFPLLRLSRAIEAFQRAMQQGRPVRRRGALAMDAQLGAARGCKLDHILIDTRACRADQLHELR